MSDAEKKRLEAKHQAIINDLLKLPENRTCADCGEKGPRWASWNIGCFLCLRCAGVHRRMGTHISRVKSVNLDTWTEEQIESIRHKGNALVNAEYNPNPQRHPVPPVNDDQALEHYIREKYEKKSFKASPKGVEPPSKVKVAQEYGSGSSMYRNEVDKLRDMGFNNAEASLAALRKTNGDVNAAVALLVKQTNSSAAPAASHSGVTSEQRMSALMSMGFKDEEANRRALEQTKGNVNEAVSLLVKGSVASAKPAATALPAKPAQQPNLLGDDLLDAPSASQATNQGAAGGFGGFGDFATAAPAAATHTSPTSELFADFASGTANQPGKASKNDIMSLFTGSAAPAPAAANAGFFGAPTAAANPYAQASPFGAQAPASAPYGAFAAAPPANPYGVPPGNMYGGAAPAANPFAAQTNPYATQANPYAAQANPYAAQANPYAAAGSPYGAPVNPYGAPAANPYGMPGGNPYGAYGAPPAAAAANPYGANVANPFAGGAVGGGVYGAPASSAPTASPGNPFASSTAKPSTKSDAFSSLSWN